MSIFKQLMVSLYSPKKLSLFRFQNIGKTIMYIFVLTFMSILPSALSWGYSAFQNPAATKTMLTEELRDFTISNDSTQIVIICLIIIGLFILAAGSKFIEAAIFAYIGLVLARMLHRKLTYKPSWTIAAYSGTLTTILFTITKAFSFSIPGQAYWHWGITGTMLFLAISHIPPNKKTSH